MSLDLDNLRNLDTFHWTLTFNRKGKLLDKVNSCYEVYVVKGYGTKRSDSLRDSSATFN